ncbi:hypothetical protein JCM3774_001166 [Rhodotorula dairenensis]
MPRKPSTGLVACTCAAITQLAAFSRHTWRCLPALPANTAARLVALKRPITFTVALIAALVAVVASWVFSLTGLEPPTCPADGPRTRRRPASPVLSESHHRHESSTQAQAAFESLSSFVSDTLRPKPVTDRPPISKHRSLRTAPRFAYHELDGVLEDAEEEELAVRSQPRSRPVRATSPTSSRTSTESAMPALTPDAVSDADTDDLSDYEVSGDSAPLRVAGSNAAKAGKPRGLQIFTSGFKWKRTSSHDGKTPTSSSPTSTTPSSDTDRPASSPHGTGLALQPTRQRASTIAHAHGPALPSTLLRPCQRRHASDSDSSASWTPASSAASIGSSAPTPTAGASQQSGRKRAQTSLFFRSLSPLSKSPTGSPENSPPSSPRLRATSTAACPAIAISSLRRRGASPARKSSLDSESSRSSTDSSRDSSQPQPAVARGRKPAFGHRLPVPSPPLSHQVVDLGGQSGLSLGDFARS